MNERLIPSSCQEKGAEHNKGLLTRSVQIGSAHKRQPTFVNEALRLLESRFSIIPVNQNKSPRGRWQQYQTFSMTQEDARQAFRNGARLGVVCGSISGNLECLDIDDPGAYQPFLDLLEMRYQGLPAKLLKRRTPSGGFHLIYRSSEPVQGNLKLACNQAGGVRIETRGEGGYFLSAPSPGYEVIFGRMVDCPTLVAEEVQAIHETAKVFDQRQKSIPKGTPLASTMGGNSQAPGNQFNQTHQVAEILEEHGWTPDRRTTAGEGWTRPGKESGISGVLLAETGNFYVWSSNAAPLEPGKSYNPFALFAAYNHDGDYTAAARELARQGYGGKSQGEAGEPGEKPTTARKAVGRKRGEAGRILGENEAAELLRKAEKVLKPLAVTSPDYPVEALGPLAEAGKTLATEGQVPVEMAGQCLLATAALLTQSRANVRTLGGIKPLSLFSLTVAESGEGKSTADDAAQHQITEWQRAAAKEYTSEMQCYEAEKTGRGKNDPKPFAPREPYRIMRDGTVEGIRRSFRQGVPSQGVFSSEAAVMLAGYGMSPDHRAKSAGNFNSLWDTGEISVARGLDGRLQLYDRRLSLHWMVQPDVAYTAIHDPLLSNIGFWPRFLLACPPPSPPLLARRFDPGRHSEIRAFWETCFSMLVGPLGEDCSRLPIITPTPEAEKLACRFYESMQKAAKTTDGLLVDVKPFAVRATEQAFRVAGVLAAFAGQTEIDMAAMKNGISLAAYSLETWRNVFGDSDEQAARTLALSLFGWMLNQPGQQASKSAVLRIGPKGLRLKDRRDTAIAQLQQSGLIGHELETIFVLREVTV